MKLPFGGLLLIHHWHDTQWHPGRRDWQQPEVSLSSHHRDLRVCQCARGDSGLPPHTGNKVPTSNLSYRDYVCSFVGGNEGACASAQALARPLHGGESNYIQTLPKRHTTPAARRRRWRVQSSGAAKLRGHSRSRAYSSRGRRVRDITSVRPGVLSGGGQLKLSLSPV